MQTHAKRSACAIGCLIVATALITYGITKAMYSDAVFTKQARVFEKYFADNPNVGSVVPTLPSLRKRVLLAPCIYPGWPQALMPVAGGLIMLTISLYYSPFNAAKNKTA